MNGMKLRMLVMGCILVVLGTTVYFALGGLTRALILDGVGIAFLVGSAVYPNRAKQEAAG